MTESINITIYDAGNGRPLRKLEVFSQREVEMNTRDGEGWVLGTFTDATHYIENGDPVEIPACPHACGSFDFASKVWVNTDADTISEKRIIARYDVNAWAARERSRLITITAGQSGIYEMKRAEAAALITDGDPDPADYPLSFGEVGITGGDPYEVAQVILNMSAMSKAGLVDIEARRVRFLDRISTASLEEIDKIISQMQM